MRVIITGGTGLIGRALAASLAADRAEVIVLSRNPDRATGLPASVRAVRWDGRTAAGWAELADGAEAIVNLAGESIARGLWTTARKQRIRDSRLNAGRAVVEAVEKTMHRPRVLVQSSGVGYYGPRGDEDVTEAASPGADFLACLAVEWEASTEPVEALGVRRTIIRTAGVLSTAGGLLPLLVLPFRFFVGGRLGDGRQWLPWIHIADQVGAIRFLIREDAAHGPFNLVSPNALTHAQFMRTVGQVMRRPVWVPLPAFAVRLLLGEMSSILLTGQKVTPRRLLDLGFTFRFRELDVALQDLLK